MPPRLSSQPRHQPAAARRHSSTAGSRARRPRGSDTACRPPSRTRRSSCTCSGSRCKLRLAASGVLRISRRRGKGLRGHGGLSRLIFCTCFQAPTPASPASFATAQDGRSDSPPTRRCSPANPCCLSPSSGKGSKKGHVDAVTAAALETASTPAASSQQRRRAGSLDQPHEACTVAGAGSSPKLAAREAPGGRLCGGSGRPTDRCHDTKKSSAYSCMSAMPLDLADSPRIAQIKGSIKTGVAATAHILDRGEPVTVVTIKQL